MIHEFIESWELFQHTWLAGWLIGLLLSLVGVIVVAKDQIFLGAAVSQASTLGVALAMWVAAAVAGNPAQWVEADLFLSGMAVLLSVAAALVTSLGTRAGGQSYEAITGWVFLVGASGAILLMAHSPHGLEEVHRLTASTIIGATAVDVWILSGFLLLIIGILVTQLRRLLLMVMDRPMAAAVGLRPGLWDVGIAIWLGVTVGLSLRISGMLYTFGCLVLPALVAKNLCREVRPMFLVAPVVVLLSAAAGFVLAHEYDYPPAQMVVALLSGLFLLLWLLRPRRWG